MALRLCAFPDHYTAITTATKNDRGAWSDAPAHHLDVWAKMEPAYQAIIEKYPKLNHVQRTNHLDGAIHRVADFVQNRRYASLIYFRHFGRRVGPDLQDLYALLLSPRRAQLQP
jgi:hypothetical protein